MRKIEGFDLVNEAGEYKQLPAGAYACRIADVVDVADKEYLEIWFDIVEGEYKDYFGNIEKATGKNYGRAFRSYKQTAVTFFKSFITAVEKTNPGYIWDWNEKTLAGKFVVIVFGEEEYIDSNNELKVSVKPQEFRSGEALRKGKIETPERRKLSAADIAKLNGPKTKTETSATFDGDLPF